VQHRLLKQESFKHAVVVRCCCQ